MKDGTTHYKPSQFYNQATWYLNEMRINTGLSVKEIRHKIGSRDLSNDLIEEMVEMWIGYADWSEVEDCQNKTGCWEEE
jgi:hypothetical protein